MKTMQITFSSKDAMRLAHVLSSIDKNLRKRYAKEYEAGDATFDMSSEGLILTIKGPDHMIDHEVKDWNGIKNRIARRTLRAAGVDAEIRIIN